MRDNNAKSKTVIIAGLTAIVLSATLFSYSISNEKFALATSSTSSNTGLRQQLQDEKDKVAALMDSQPNAAGRAVSISEKGGVPVVITYVDGRTSQLVVGISDKAPLSKIAYEERMKAIV